MCVDGYCASHVLLATPHICSGLCCKRSLLGVAMLMSFVAGMFGSVASPNIKAIVLNVNDPELRGVAMGLQVGPSPGMAASS